MQRSSSKLAVDTSEFLEACTPGYYNNEGKPAQRTSRNSSYGGGSIEFIEMLEEWRTAGGLEGLELVP